MRRNTEERKKYNREHSLRRYYNRRSKAFEKLGGVCNVCGSAENLQMDHIDSTTKKYAIGKMWSIRESEFWREVAKCQILCRSCHDDKSIGERGMRVAKGAHGRLSTYRYCHCSLCRKAKNEYTQEYRRKKRLGV